LLQKVWQQKTDRVDSNGYRVNTIQQLLAVGNGVVLLEPEQKVQHLCLQRGVPATTNMTGHGGTHSLSTQEITKVDTSTVKY
jgi:hypothetical protein